MKFPFLIAMLMLPGVFGWSEEPAKPSTRPFLGVHVIAVPAEVRAQTELEEGEGLMVDFLQDGSPARVAGIEVFDILTHLEDQKLLSGEQFSHLIKAAGSGEEIRLSLLRKGKPLIVSATLIDAPAENHTPRIAEASAEMNRFLPELLKALQKEAHDAGPASASPPAAASMSMSDQEGSVEISRASEAHTATVKDVSGKVLFSGSIQTEAQLQALSPEVRARITKLEQSAKAVTGPR